MVSLWFIPLLVLLGQGVPNLVNTTNPSMVSMALRLSIASATISTLLTILLGTPLAYLLARYNSWLLTLIDILVDLPLILPAAVAGVALLIAFGRNGVVGQFLSPLGIELPFSMAAVILAQMFVAAPFYVRSAKVGFAEIDPRLEQISAILGESDWGTFRRVTLPLSRHALLAGATMTWARAIGEFGATIIFAGNLPGRTQTMPLAIFSALQLNLSVALLLSTILLVVSFGILLLLRLMTRYSYRV
ncbi:ABC transporter permease [Anaerolineales bacterium HSG6]|nr:ABC transporter permease [Anaerolineales bacterium HSG6]